MSELPISILMVDDRPENLVSLGAILDLPGYQLVKAGSGREALKALLEEDFALVLLDVQMPGMDGFETAALIKQRPKTKHIPIIFITANSQDEKFVYRGYDAGAVDYILKPISPDILRSKVAVFADLYRKTRQLLKQAELQRENERLERERRIAMLEAESARRERAANQKYRDLIAGLRHGIVWLMDPVTLIPTFLSERIEDLLGYDVRTNLMDIELLRQVSPKDDCERLIQMLRHTIETHEEQILEHRVITKDGRELWFQTVARMGEKSDKPGVMELRGLSIDITPIKRAEQSALESVRSREEFLSVASHELKTPLTSLKLQLQGVRRFLGRSPQLMTEKIPVIAERCERQVDRMTRLVDELLDVTKIGTGALHMSAEDFDLATLLREVCARFAPDLKQAGCTLKLLADEPVRGHWDMFRLDQVFTNLLSNAIKYGPSAPIEVRVTLEQNYAVLRVRDHGIGISSLDQDRIFGRFERVTSRGPGGLGLGLYIARKIVEAHQGSIQVESEPGKGSLFSVRIPVAAISAGLSDSVAKETSEPLRASGRKSL